MKTIGLKRLENVDVNEFTNGFKMKLRRMIFPATRLIINTNTKLISGKNVIIDRRPDIPKNEQVIFASTHGYTEDIESALGSLDRNAWVLIGTKDQIENNFKMYGAWLNGMIYVDRKDDSSRKESLEKMKYILNNGSSILIFPEGGWNNKENELCMNLFGGAYYLSSECKKRIVPMSSIVSEKDNQIHVLYGDPIDLSLYRASKNDSEFLKNIKKMAACSIIRDSMASLSYELIEKYTNPISRKQLPNDVHNYHNDNRLREYMKTRWSSHNDVKNELTEYKPKIYLGKSDISSELEKLQSYEKLINDCLFCGISGYAISYGDAISMYNKLKFAYSPEKAIELISKLKSTFFDSEIVEQVLSLDVDSKEPFIRDIVVKEKVDSDEVWSFVDQVHLGADNAESMAKTVVQVKQSMENEKKNCLDNYIENNYNTLKLEKKNKNKNKKL